MENWGVDASSTAYTGEIINDPDEYWRVDADVYRIFLELAPHTQGESIDLGELPELCRQVGRPLRDDHEQFRLMQELDTTNSMIILRHDCVVWLLREIHAEEQARLDAAPRPVPVATPVWEEAVQEVSEVDMMLGTKPTVFYYNTVSGESIWELPSLVRCLWSHFESQEAAQVSNDEVPGFLKDDSNGYELLQQLRELFLKYDDDNSGYVDISEFEDLCVRVGQAVNGREGLLALIQEVDPYSSPVSDQPLVSWEALKHYWITNSPFQRRTRLSEPQYASWEQIEVLNSRSTPILFRHTTTQQERWGHPAMEQRVADRLNHLFPSLKLDWTQKISLFLDVQRQQGGTWNLETCWRVFNQFNHPMTRLQHVQDVIEQLLGRFGAQEDRNEAQTLDEGIIRSWLLYCTKKVDMGGWEEVVDAEGQSYYYHEVNGLTQWDPPQLQTQMATMLDKLGGQPNLSADEQIARVFRQFDADESGEMTVDEFQHFYRALLGRGSASTLTDAQIRKVFSVLDASGDGSVTLEEFQFWWKTKLQIEMKETSQVETITRDERRREICLQFLENEDAIALIPGGEEEHFESNLLPRLVALLCEFPLRGLTYRRALNELVTDPMEQLVSLKRFLEWFDRFDTAEREKLELQRAKQRAQAELRAQHEAQAAAREKQRRRRKQMRTLDAMNEQVTAIAEREAQQQREKKVAVLFKTFDTDGSGVLDEKELLQLTKALGQEMDPTQVTRMMKVMDSSGDGRINLEEFLAFWKAFEHRRPVVSAAVVHQTRRDAVSEPVTTKEAPHLTTGDAVASLSVSLEMLKDRALKLTLADMRGFLGDWRDDLNEKRMEHQAEHDKEKRLQELRAMREFIPSKTRVYGAKRLDVTWIEPEVVDCVAEIIMNVGLRFDPLLKPDAAQRIQALVRGHLARIHLLNVVRDRFEQHVDPSTRLFYFVDGLTGRILLTRPLFPINTSSIAPLERADCSTKAEKYQFDKRLLERQAKKRFYDQECLPLREETYQHRPMLARSVFFMFDVTSSAQRRLFGSIWTPLRSPQPELELVELIARRRRRQLMQRGRDAAGNLPLHYAVRHSQFPVSVISVMVKGYPEALLESDAFGMTPLHLAFREQRTSIKLLRLLSRTFTKREKMSIWTRQTVCGETPLHVAILHHASVGVLQWVLPSCAQEIKDLVPKLFNKRGESAFHSCISQQRQMSEESSFSSTRSRTAVLLFLKHFDPVVLCSTPTKDGDLPLHLAMDAFEHQKTSTDKSFNGTGWLWLVNLLLTHYPAAAFAAKRSNGLLPVHLSIKYGFPEELSMKIFNLHVAASDQEKSLLKATTIADTGPTLLHYTLVHQPQATKLLSLLLKQMPSACSSCIFATGDLPIHTAAAAHGVGLDIVRSLCEVNAEGCRTYNLKRFLPLHIAIIHDVGNVEKLRILLLHCQELVLSDTEEKRGLRALLMAANTKIPDYQAVLTLLDVAPNRKLSVTRTKSKVPPVTPLYALSLRRCTPEITRRSVATSCHEKFESLEDEEKYFLAMAKAKLRKQHYNPTPKLPFSKILELVERNPLDEALIQRALYAMNEKLRSMNEAEEQESTNNHETRKGYGLVVDTITLNSDLMLVRAVHQTMYEFPANPRLQLLGQAVLTKLLPSAYVRAAYKAKIDPYFNL
ncbi:putative calcium-binding protein CML8 [Phytophthora citrophthora]|uniref:Calcium-binding protein CML8 n=1 Tax=Phytophthora citrophthora TaxID=4793 RepID=A0AAD9GXE3_9STRA|nr:putative calcium-binding protein CML8 [Phytophthora citrophthora]